MILLNEVRYRGTRKYTEAKRLLIRTARARQTIGYAPFFDILGFGPGNHAAAEAGHLLGEISEDAVRVGLPMLTALVVSSTTKRPGSGFYVLAGWLGKIREGATDMQKEAFWRAEKQKVYAANWDEFEKQESKVESAG